MKSVVNLNSKGFPWRDMTENMQAAGLEADHAAAKPKKTKKTAAAAADFALLRRDQERWERADPSMSASKKSRLKKSERSGADGKPHPKSEAVEVSIIDHPETTVEPVLPAESGVADTLEAMMGWLQNEIDAAHGMIERYRTTINVKRINNHISKKEANRLSKLLDIRLAELDEIIRLGNEGEHDQEVIERLRALQDDLDVHKHGTEASVATESLKPNDQELEYGFVVEAGVEIVDAEQGGSRYRIEEVAGDKVSCVLLTHDENYAGTLVFNKNDPKNSGRFSRAAASSEAVSENSQEKEKQIESGDEMAEWQQLFTQCTKDAAVMMDILTDAAEQLVALLGAEMGAEFDQASQRACVAAYFEKVFVQVGGIAVASDRERALDIVMRRISKNVLQ